MSRNESKYRTSIILMTRQQKDHDRYIANREERLKKQREYYRTHREYYLNYMKSLVERERIKLYGNNLKNNIMEYLGYHNDFSKQELINQKREEAEKNGWKVKEIKESSDTYRYECEQGDWYYKTCCGD